MDQDYSQKKLKIRAEIKKIEDFFEPEEAKKRTEKEKILLQNLMAEYPEGAKKFSALTKQAQEAFRQGLATLHYLEQQLNELEIYDTAAKQSHELQ